MNNVHAVILAGGSGTRFWPMSRAKFPKQFLPLINGRSLFEETLLRIQKKIPGERIWIVSNKIHAASFKSFIKKYKIPSQNVLLEPSGKNTAPAIAWAAALIHQKNPQAVMAVLPSDHFIKNTDEFYKSFKRAVEIAQKDFLVTLGITPIRPETGFGYIKTKVIGRGARKIQQVEAFIEKPLLAQAQKFLRSKNYYWNSGMFIWKTKVILDEIKDYLPGLSKIISSPKNIYANWHEMPSISIDYGIMEKSRRVACVPAGNIGWSDLGSWLAFGEIAAKNKEQNVLQGNIIVQESNQNIIFGKKRLIAVAGVDNLIIVDTDDALLICRKDRSQQVKNIVDTLKKQNKEHLI